MKWLLGGLAAVIVILAGVFGFMVYRANGLTGAAEAGLDLKLPPPPPIDDARAAEHLGAAIRIRTISHTPGVVDDPQAFADLRALLETTYPRTHATLAREIVKDHTLVYTWPGSDPALAPMLILAHQDVVPVEAGTEGDWPAPPFSGAMRDGYVWGRGAVDDKGSLIALFEAVEALINQGFQPKRTIIIALGHDEEVNGAGAQAVAALLKERGVKAWFVLDEGMTGVLDFPLTHGPAALIGIAEKGYMTVAVTARGEGGHSSMPQEDTAAERLSRAVLAIRRHPFKGGLDEGPAGAMLDVAAPHLSFVERLAIANRWALNAVLIDTMGATPSGNALLRTTIAPTMMNGGAKENVLPQEMTAIVNLRLHPRDSVDGALAHLREAVAGIEGVSIEIEGTANNPSPVSSTDSDSYALISAAVRATAPDPKAPVLPMLVLAATDSRHYAGVAENVYRFQPVWAEQAEFSRIHGTGERISVENLGRWARFYAQVIAGGAA